MNETLLITNLFGLKAVINKNLQNAKPLDINIMTDLI